MVEQARAEREEMLRAHVGEVRAMLDEWENRRERRRTLSSASCIPLAANAPQAALAAYRGGKAGIADVLVARRSEIDVRLQALQLELETARLWAQLNFLIPRHRTRPHAERGHK